VRVVSEKKLAKRKYVRVSESTWAEIEGLWETGDATLPDLEARYSVSRRALQARFAKRKIVKGAKAAQMAAAVKEEVFAENLADINTTTARAKETREAAYQNAVVVENLIMAQLAAAQKDPSQALKAAAAIKALSLAAAGLERIHSLKWRALGLDKDSVQQDQLPVLLIEDLSEAEIKAMQDGHAEDDGDDDIIECSSGPSAPDDREDDLAVEAAAGKPPTSGPATVDGCRLVRDAGAQLRVKITPPTRLAH
jgi:hypothetical protein